MPASEIGVSKTRSSPNFACKPSVTRKTPPSLPTSSPYTSSRGSSSIASISARLSAADRVHSPIERLLALACQDGGRLRERPVEHPLGERRLGGRDARSHLGHPLR